MASPVEVLRADRQLALRLSETAGRKSLRAALFRAQKGLEQRLRASGGEFTREKIKVTLRQVQSLLGQVNEGITSAATAAGDKAAEDGADNTVRYLAAAERKFGGISERLQLKEGLMFDRAVSGTRSSILHRLKGDPKKGPGILARYGDDVVQHFERVLQERFIAGTPWEEAKQQLVQGSPFLEQAPAHWAERILRTEVMNAHGMAQFEATREAQRQLGDVVKILSCVFDDRTGADSIAVHGQIRRPSEAFETWYGLRQHPPDRPNDRAVVVTHRISWPIPPELKWRGDSEVSARWHQEGRKGSPPGRPNMTTVPLEEFGKAQPSVVVAPRQEPIEEPAPVPQKPRRGPVASPFFDEDIKPYKQKVAEAMAEHVASRHELILGDKLSGPKGSNPGGLYRGRDGVERYVKYYDDPAQAWMEHLANQIYADLGAPAVKSEVFTTAEGKVAYSSDIVAGKTLKESGSVKSQTAKKVLDNFATDVLVGNWDAVGQGLDNILVAKGGKPVRIDKGGSLLMRAKAGRKSEHVLGEIPEWEKFFDPSVNKDYAGLAKVAGVSRAEDIKGLKGQIKKISDLRDRSGGWRAYVERNAPGLPEADLRKVVDMLEKRSALLTIKARSLKKVRPKKAGDREFHELPKKSLDPYRGKPRGYEGKSSDSYADEVATKISGWASEHHEEFQAMKSYTGGTYREIRDTHWLSKDEWFAKHGTYNRQDKYEAYKKKYADLTKGFDQAPAAGRGAAHEESLTDLYRGIHDVSDAKLRELANVKEYEIEAITSTSWKTGTAERFGYEGSEPDKNAVIFHYKLKPTSTHKLAVENKSSNPGEGEVLFKHGLKFKVVDAHQMEGRKRTLLLTLEEM